MLLRPLLFLSVLSLGQVGRRQTGGVEAGLWDFLALSQSVPGLRPDHARKVSRCSQQEGNEDG